MTIKKSEIEEIKFHQWQCPHCKKINADATPPDEVTHYFCIFCGQDVKLLDE